MPITTNELDHRFDFHRATPITAPAYESIRAICKEAARQILSRTPESREQSLAVTHLEEAMFWANAAVARHGLTEGIPANRATVTPITDDPMAQQMRKING